MVNERIRRIRLHHKIEKSKFWKVLYFYVEGRTDLKKGSATYFPKVYRDDPQNSKQRPC